MSLDKDAPIVSFLLPLLENHKKTSSAPFILGITGLQGSGKSYLVSSLHKALISPPYSLSVATFSIDDLYHPFAKLEEIRLANPTNKLLSHRGEPGTHDMQLAVETFDSLLAGKETPIPDFDKSRNSGRGDRIPKDEWRTVKGPVDVVIFEGWCVGFRAISESQVEEKWRSSRESGAGVIGRHELEHVQWINEALRGYDQLTDKFDAFVHLDAEKLEYVYAWRLQQEHNLIKLKGAGMTDEQVVAFIDGYLPGYELYLEKVRDGVVKAKTGDSDAIRRNLRIVMGKGRETVGVETVP